MYNETHYNVNDMIVVVVNECENYVLHRSSSTTLSAGNLEDKKLKIPAFTKANWNTYNAKQGARDDNADQRRQLGK